MATIDEKPRNRKGADEPRTTGQIMSTREYEARERTTEARAITAENRAKATTRKPATPDKVQMPKTIRRLVQRHPHRVLVAELMAMLALITTKELSDGHAPAMQAYVSAFVVYLVLAFASEFGEDTARTAAAFGLLVILGYLLAPGHAAAVVKGLNVSTHPATSGPVTNQPAPPGVTIRPSRLPQPHSDRSTGRP